VDPVIEKIIGAGLAERYAVQQSDHIAAMARARDTALHGLKVVEAVTAKELLVSDDPGDAGRNNLFARNPTTLGHDVSGPK